MQGVSSLRQIMTSAEGWPFAGSMMDCVLVLSTGICRWRKAVFRSDAERIIIDSHRLLRSELPDFIMLYPSLFRKMQLRHGAFVMFT